MARAALVGHAMGALVALELAARHSGRVRALALLGVADRMLVSPALFGAAATLDGPGDDPGGPGVLETDLAACDGYRGAAAAGMRVRCPALLLLGQANGRAPVRFG